MNLMNVKGTYDYYKKKQNTREYVIDTLKSIFKKYGYESLETPILCYYDLLASKYGGGAEILKEVYKLSDQGNRELGLRYDLTVPFAKVIAMNINKTIQAPFKRYEIGKVFRDGPVKVGRNREFTQCDVDVIGIKSIMADAEFIALYVDAFNKLGIDIDIEYNNRKLLSGFIIESNIPENIINEVITIVDKFKKLTREELEKEFDNINVTKEQYNKLITYLTYDFNQIKKEFENTNNKILKEGIDELEELNDYIKCMKLDKYVSFTSSLARGHDIYTGTIYEVFMKNREITSSIGGGGRYDKIITNFVNDGNEYPAIGASFGLEIICEILEKKENLNNNTNTSLYIIPLETNKEAMVLANKLRLQNINVDIAMTNQKLKKALNYANKENIPFVIILGQDEIKNNKITIKNMVNSTSEEIELDNTTKIKEIIDNFNV